MAQAAGAGSAVAAGAGAGATAGAGAASLRGSGACVWLGVMRGGSALSEPPNMPTSCTVPYSTSSALTPTIKARRRLARKRPIRLVGVSSSLCSSARGPSTAPSLAAACAARRAAAMKFALPVISVPPSRFIGASAASDAAIRSAGERPRPALPGSSGVSAGRSGSIGGRSGRWICMNGAAARCTGSDGCCAGASPITIGSGMRTSGATNTVSRGCGAIGACAACGSARAPVSTMARRSTRRSSVSCTASSVSCVRWSLSA